jgi:energy-coupling factor transporter transmembrane protein EcfT
MALHPAIRIILGLSLIILSSALGFYPLLAAILALVLWLIWVNDSIALRWVRRARYLLIVPPIISGYTIAGTGIFPLDIWAPTWEGLTAGAMQSLRLLLALLALRLSLRGLSADQLVQGLVGLLSPFERMGLNVRQLARRLTLTLNYLSELDGRKARELLIGLQQSRPTAK